MDAESIYRRARERITELAQGLSDEQLATAVPGSPAWTVKDVVGHLAGVVADVQAGRIEGAATEPWTQRQVDDRRDTPVGDVIAEWSTAAPAFEQLVGQVPALARTVMDILTHEADIRGALDIPPAAEVTDDIVDANQQVMAALDTTLKAADGAPGLRVKSGTDEWILGPGEPAATLTVSPYELFRAAIGRRSDSQFRGYDWQGDPSPYVPLFAFFSFAEKDLSEPT